MQQAEYEHAAYLRPPAAAGLLGIGLSTLWAHAKTDPALPAIKLGSRTTVFRRADLIAWAEARAKKVA